MKIGLLWPMGPWNVHFILQEIFKKYSGHVLCLQIFKIREKYVPHYDSKSLVLLLLIHMLELFPVGGDSKIICRVQKVYCSYGLLESL